MKSDGKKEDFYFEIIYMFDHLKDKKEDLWVGIPTYKILELGFVPISRYSFAVKLSLL